MKTQRENKVDEVKHKIFEGTLYDRDLLNCEAETDTSNVKHREEFGLQNESGENKSFLK